MAKKPLFNEDGLYTRTFTRIFDLVLLSIFTLVASIPIVTAGPAFAALLYCNKKLIKRDHFSVAATFWSTFASNFKKGMPLWLIALDLTAVLAGGVLLIVFGKRYFGEGYSPSQLMVTIIALVGFFVVTWLAQTMPLFAFFENTTMGTLKTAFQIPFACPFRAILVMLFEVVPIALCVLYPLLFFLEGVIGIGFFGQCVAKTYMKIAVKLGYEDELKKPEEEEIEDPVEEGTEMSWAEQRLSLADIMREKEETQKKIDNNEKSTEE